MDVVGGGDDHVAVGGDGRGERRVAGEREMEVAAVVGRDGPAEGRVDRGDRDAGRTVGRDRVAERGGSGGGDQDVAAGRDRAIDQDGCDGQVERAAVRGGDGGVEGCGVGGDRDAGRAGRGDGADNVDVVRRGDRDVAVGRDRAAEGGVTGEGQGDVAAIHRRDGGVEGGVDRVNGDARRAGGGDRGDEVCQVARRHGPACRRRW